MNQTEQDIERHVLSQTKKLSDGSSEKIFARNPRGENGAFSYNCHLCGVASLNGERSLQTHITGKKHQQRLVYDYIPDAVEFRLKIAQSKVLAPPMVHPGEPIPPGFEDEMPSESYLDSIIKNVEKPLIGLEYVAELHDSKAKEPLYICMLCDKRCDPRNIIAQVTSHRHRMKYLDFHFGSVMKKLNVTKKFNLDMAYREEVLTSIARDLENRFGRQKLPMFDYKDFERRKSEIVEETKNAKHFNEHDFPNCDEILLKKFHLKNHELDDVSSDEGNDMYASSNDSKKRASTRFADRRTEIDETRFRSMKVSTPSTSYFRPTLKAMSPQLQQLKRIVTPRELSESSNAKMQEKYTTEKYRASLEYATKEIEARYKEHERAPENHPKYSDEWKAFWARRYKELLAAGKDANGYDYRPEWIEFWTRRMHQLRGQEIEAKRKELQKKLKLTPEQAKRVESERRNSRSPARKRASRSPIEISDDDSSNSDNNNDESEDERRPRHSVRRRRMNTNADNEDERSRSHDSPYVRRRSPSPEADNEVNLVTVCRLLSVLETELGMLAPKVIDLLSRALSIEKKSANSCDNLLLADEHMILMETAKEKLKGGLAAGLIAREKITVVKRAITNIAKLIYEVNERKPKAIVVSEKPPMPAVKVEKAPAADTARLEIARVIAAALAEQGKQDLPTEELEALIESFLGDQDEELKVEEEEKKVEVKKEETKKEEEMHGLENLTDDDLKTLLRNFSELTSDEQNHLITYLSKIERTDVARVEKLRKYVDIGDEDIDEMEVEENIAVKKSPEPQNALSDDEYGDEPTPSMKDMHTPIFENASMLANDLLSSLNAASMPIQQHPQQQPQQHWEMMQPQQIDFYQPVYSHSELLRQQEFYNQQMEASLTAAPWPQTSASTFTSEGRPPIKNGRGGFRAGPPQQQQPPVEHVPYRKRMDRPNNTQLTGKGAKRN